MDYSLEVKEFSTSHVYCCTLPSLFGADLLIPFPEFMLDMTNYQFKEGFSSEQLVQQASFASQNEMPVCDVDSFK